MSDKLSAVIAAFNEGANKGFWRFQWRDRYGRWVEMGRGVLGKLRLKDGSIADVRGVFVGGTENPGFGRVLVEGLADRGVPDGIYHFASGNGEKFDAIIPEEALERIGVDSDKKDIFGNSVGERLDKDIQDLDQIVREDITPEDRKLATEVPDDNQKKIIDEERAKSPVAKLPAGTESRDPNAVKKILEENPLATTTVPVKDAVPEEPKNIYGFPKFKNNQIIKPASKAWLTSDSRENGEPIYWSTTNGKGIQEGHLYDGYVYFDDFSEDESYQPEGVGSVEEFLESMESGRGVQAIYKGRPPLVEEDGKLRKANKFDIMSLRREQLADQDAAKAAKSGGDSVDKAVKDAFDKANSGEVPNIDDVIDRAQADKNNKGNDPFEGFDFLDDDDEDAKPVTPKKPAKTPDAEPPVKPTKKTPDAKPPVKPTKKTPDVVKPPKGVPQEPAETPGGEQPSVKQLTMAELDALGKPEEYIDDFGGFTPSDEQTRVLNALVKAKVSTVVDSVAGAGKTTTITAACRAKARLSPDDRILIITFGNKNAEDAKRKSPRINTDARTSHSLATKIMYRGASATGIPGSQWDAWSTKYSVGRIAAKEDDIALVLGCDDTSLGAAGNLDPGDAANIVQRAIVKFCNSTDKKVNKDHILQAFKDKFDDGTGEFPADFEVPDKFLDWANKFWENVSTPYIRVGKYDPSKKKFVGDKRIRITDDHYFKIWALSNPDLSELKVNGKKITDLYVDEAQDTNPCFAEVLRNNSDKIRVSFVGDTDQNIFGFRGSENVLKDARKTAGAAVDLTETRRYGDGMAAPSNAALNLKRGTKRIKGTGTGGQLMDWEDMPDGPEKALIVRSNFGGITEILNGQNNGKTVGALSKFYEEVVNAVYYLKWLKEDFNTRSKSPTRPVKQKDPETGEITTVELAVESPDFRGITTMKDLYRHRDRNKNSLPSRMLGLLESKDNKIEPFIEMIDKLVIDESDSTAVSEVFDGSENSTGNLWNNSKGEFVYVIDGEGTLTLSGGAVWQKMPDGRPWLDHFKDEGFGFRWDKEEKAMKLAMPTGMFDDNDRADLLSKIAKLIPNRVPEKDARVPDFIVTTAHRAKGLEWDYIAGGVDWRACQLSDPDVDPETGKIDAGLPSVDELNLAYVALSRGRKGIDYEFRPATKDDGGGLGWMAEFEGREGLAKLNAREGLDPNFGMEAWDYWDAQVAAQKEKDKNNKDKPPSAKSGPTTPKDIARTLGCTGFDGQVTWFDDDVDLPDTSSRGEFAGPTSRTPKFLQDWIPNTDPKRKRWSKNVDGFRWELTQNSDGSVTVRPRTDPDIGTKKFKNLQEAIKNFKELTPQGTQSNRNKLKEIIKPFDKKGIIAKAIDEGKSASEINDMITSTQDWEDAIDDNNINFISLKAALSRVGNGDTNINKRPTRKPAVIKKKKAATQKPATTTTTTKRPASQPTGVQAPPRPPLYDSVRPEHRDTGADIPRKALNRAVLEPLFESQSSPEQINKSLVFYGGKVAPDGSIVLHRSTKKEKFGPARKQERTIEIRVKEAKDNTFVMIIKSTNPATGESREFYHYKKHHSLLSIVGDANQEKSVGVERLLNQYFDRDVKTNPYPNDEYQFRYGGIEGAIKKLRAGSLQNLLRDRKASDSAFKLRTAEEHAALAFNGRDRRLNTSLQNWWTQSRVGRGSIFEALERGDKNATVALFRSYMNGVPDTKDAKSKALKYLTESLKRKFPNLDQRELKHILTNVENQVTNELPPTGSPVQTWLSNNGKIIKPNNIVRYKNNVDNFGIGQVRDRIRVENPSSGLNSYGDYVTVQFAGGNPIKLNTKHLEVVSDSEELTPPKPWMYMGALMERRSLEAGYDVDYDTGAIYDKNNTVIGNIFINDESEFDLEEAEGRMDALEGKLAEDLKVGDVLHDGVTGMYQGNIAQIRQLKDKTDGSIKIGIVFNNGEKLVLESDDDVFTLPDRQVNKPVRGPMGQRAMDLGLGIDSKTGKTARTLSILPNDATIPENNTKIAGKAKMTALKPTDEARAAKDEAVAIGKEVWEKGVEPIILIKLKNAGYSIDSLVEFEGLQKAAQAEADEASKKYADSKRAISKYLDTQIKGMSAADLATAEDSMTKEKLISSSGVRDVSALETRLRDAGFNGLASEVANLVPSKGATESQRKLFAFGHKMLNSKNSSQINKVTDLFADQDKKNRERIAAVDKVSKAESALGVAESSATKEAMEAEGVQFDSVSYREFKGRLISTDANLPFEPGNSFLSARAIQQAFGFMPRSQILSLIKHLEDNNLTFKIRAGVRRGEFRTVAKGYELDLSSQPNPLEGQTKVTGTSVHELQHFGQRTNPTLRAMEHVWTYDRVVENPGTPEETMPRIISIPGKPDELTFAAPGVAQSYTLKQYSKVNPDIFLNPHDKSSEVMSTIVEDLFTSPGYVSRGKGATVTSKTPDGVKRTYKNAVYDSASGEWYTDSSKSTKIDNVIGSYGRDSNIESDKNVKHFGIGTLMVLNDWSATEGVGPGNAVVTPKTPKTPKTPSEPTKLVMPEGKGSVYQFQTIRKKLEDKRKDIEQATEKVRKIYAKNANLPAGSQMPREDVREIAKLQKMFNELKGLEFADAYQRQTGESKIAVPDFVMDGTAFNSSIKELELFKPKKTSKKPRGEG